MSRWALSFALILLCSCKLAEEAHLKAIIGAVLIDGLGGPPVSNSVVVVSGGRIRAAGAASTVPIPSEADKIDGSGKFLVPGLVDVFARAETAASFTAGHPASADDARARVAELARAKTEVIHLWKMEPAIAVAVLEEARASGIPVIGHISTLAEAEFLVNNGASGMVGMICDTQTLDPDFVAKLRNLRIFVAPNLDRCQPAAPNTLRLFQAGVPITLASGGGDLLRAAEVLAEAGLPPLDVIVAGTSNGAAALHQERQRGAIEAGRRADLLLLSANPGEDVRNLRKVALKMVDGEWVR